MAIENGNKGRDQLRRERVAFTSVSFRNFRALSEYSLSLRDTNVLVGPNNCGKSTVISAFRVLSLALRKATSRNPELLSTPKGTRTGYRISDLPIPVANIHTEYEDIDTTVIFRLSNRNLLTIYFPADGGCILVPETTGRPVRTVSDFKRAFPVGIGVVPVLGPLEQDEFLVSEETVRANLYTHLASRHFRSYWYYTRDGFDQFANLIQSTWRGIVIYRSSREGGASNRLVMPCEEEGRPRELFWAGFGFQIWCQLITHIVRSNSQSLLVVDEPEIYLHPDLQRQLLGILKQSGPDILMATHSTEIIGEADPGDLLLVDKKKRAAQRIKDISEVQAALESIGSLQNIELTQLARNRRVLFVESSADYRVIRRFARRLGFDSLGAGLGITAIESGGAASWEKIKHIAEGIEQTLGRPLQISAVYDRDYRCEEEIRSIAGELEPHLAFLHVHSRKEMENYFLQPTVLERALATARRERARRAEEQLTDSRTVTEILETACSALKEDIQAQYIAKRSEFLRHTGRDAATLAAETLRWFEISWNDPASKLTLVPGKEVLRRVREDCQLLFGASLTDRQIIDAFHADEIPIDLKELIDKLERFRALD
ncbi:MAG TPA: AAA family ATPase [Thermoanaerobaculia bacterium]|nr:AAA family ATPase [Thermoanaerobaculia bacterium]